LEGDLLPSHPVAGWDRLIFPRNQFDGSLSADRKEAPVSSDFPPPPEGEVGGLWRRDFLEYIIGGGYDVSVAELESICLRHNVSIRLRGQALPDCLLGCSPRISVSLSVCLAYVCLFFSCSFTCISYCLLVWSVCASLCLCVCLPVRLSICLCVCMCVCLSWQCDCLSACASVCLPVCLSACASVCMSVRLSVRLSLCSVC